ncbi:MAG: hypothetical protein II729_03965 [Ruminococcus sp.]|nr:hypothetical protein [Ruminococcus sp.]
MRLEVLMSVKKQYGTAVQRFYYRDGLACVCENSLSFSYSVSEFTSET